MKEKKLLKFKCPECGSDRIAFQKYVKCLVPVEILRRGKLHYYPVVIETRDYLKDAIRFCCNDCGHKLTHCGYQVRTERDLWYYFDNPSYRPNKSNGVLENEPRKIEEHTLDLGARIEKDGYVIRNSKEDM